MWLKMNRRPDESIWLHGEEVPGPFKLEDSELTEITQKKAYKMILRHRNRQPGNDPTKRKMEKTKNVLQKTGVCITVNDIWTNNEKGIIPPKISDFLWKLNHNRHKVGTWFLKIRGWENRAHCKCRKLETMDHIIMECPLNKGHEIWEYMESEWKQTFPKTQWLPPTIELIRGLGSIQLRERPRWMSEAYIERITEAIWLIWTTRNNRIFNRKEIPKEAAIKMLKKTLRNKKETEWIYATKIKRLSYRDKKTLELEKKWGKIMTDDQRPNNE